MEELNINLGINQLENFDSHELRNIEQIQLAKLAMEKVKQSIYQKLKNDPETTFLLKRL